MSDSDQSSSDAADRLCRLKHEELSTISEACFRASLQIQSIFNQNLTWPDIFLFSILDDKSCFDQSFKSFLSNSRVFQGISPIWDVTLSTSSYQKFQDLEEKEKYSSMYFMLDMLKGRLNFQFRGDFYFVVNSLPPHEKLYGLVLAEAYPELALKILVCFQEGEINQDEINLRMAEVAALGRVLEKFENVEFETSPFEIDDFCVRPGVVVGFKTKSCGIFSESFGGVNKEEDEKGENQKLVEVEEKTVEPGEVQVDFGFLDKQEGEDGKEDNRKLLEDNQKLLEDNQILLEDNQKLLEDNQILLEDNQILLEVKQEDVEALLEVPQDSALLDIEEKKESQPVLFQYFKDSSEVRQYIDPLVPFIPPQPTDNDLCLELFEQFKKNILEKISEFPEISENDRQSWPVLVLKWHENELNKNLDIYEKSEVFWKLSIEKKLLDILKNIREEEFVHYFYLFFKYGLGLLITEPESFFNLNKENDENLLFCIVDLPNTNLRPILAVLIIEHQDSPSQFIPKIHFFDFCDSETLETKKSEAKLTIPHVNLEKTFSKKGINSILIIEKDQKVLPATSLLNKIPARLKTIHFLYNFENPSDLNIFLVSSENKSYNASIIALNAENPSIHPFLFFFEAPLTSDSEYLIQMNLSSDNQTLQYVDKEGKRKLSSSRSIFLFNFEFKNHVKNFSSVVVPGSVLNDPFAELFFYISNLSLPEKGEDYESLIASFDSAFSKEKLRERTEKSYQFSILSFVENYIDIISGMDEDIQLEILYFVLLMIYSVEVFPFEGKIAESSLDCIIGIVKASHGKFLRVFMSKELIHFAIKGLVKCFIFAKDKGKEFKEMFDVFVDYRILRIAIKAYLDIYLDAGLEINDEEVYDMLTYCSLFRKKNKKIMFKILDSIKEPLRLFSNLNHPVFEMHSEEEKKNILRESLKKYQPSLQELVEFLKSVKEKELSFVFDQQELSKMIENSMKKHDIQLNQYFDDFKQLLGLIRLENEAGNLKVNVESIFINLLNQSSFGECMNYFLLYPECIPELFTIRVIKLMSSSSLPESLKIIEKEIESIPEDYKNQLSLVVIQQLATSNLFDFVKLFDDLHSDSLKSAYKIAFKTQNLSEPVFKSTFLELLKDKNKKNLKNCDLYQEILVEAQELLCSSEEDLTEKLLKNPNKTDLLYEFLSDEEIIQNSILYQKCFEFMKNLHKSLEEKTLLVSTLNMINHHSPSQKEAFIHYVRLIFRDINEQRQVLESLHENNKKLKEFNSFLKFMKNGVMNLASRFPEIVPLIQVYQNFMQNHEDLMIGECKFPGELQRLSDLVKEKKFPVSSKIFMNILMKHSDKKKRNFENTLAWDLTLYETLVLTISAGNIDKMTVNSFNFYFPDLSAQIITKEIIIMQEYFDGKVDINYEEIEQKLRELSFTIDEYYRVKYLIFMIGKCSRVLDLPNHFGRYSNLDNLPLNPETRNLLASLLEQEIFLLSPECIRIMKIFLSTVNDYDNIISLACSTADEDLTFWRECFVSNMDNKGLTLEIIENFILITSFFNKLKTVSDNFVFYSNYLMELLNYEAFFNIFEIIANCNSSAGLLDDYSKSLNNQEQIKLNKIKKICENSVIRVKKSKNSYFAEIFPQVAEEGDSKGLSFIEIKELKDRALLSKYIIDQKDQENRKNDSIIYKNFVEFVDYLCAFINTLTELRQTLFKLSLDIEKEYFLVDSEYLELIKDSNFYILLLNDEWKRFYKEATSRSYLINFLDGESLYKIDQFFYNRNEDNLVSIIPVLNFMQKVPPDPSGETFKRPVSMNERLIIIENFLTELPDKIVEPKFCLDRFEHYPQEPGSVIIMETKEFYLGVLTVYSNYRKMLPRGDLVLFCHYSTKWEEIKLFLNRCFLNTDRDIYTLVNPENLSFNNQLKIESRATKQFHKQESIFYLAIVTADPSCKLVSNLSNHLIIPIENVQHYQFLSEKDVDEIVKNTCKNIFVVKSAYSGLGKSRFISRDMNINDSKNRLELNIPAAFNLEEIHGKIGNLGMIPHFKFRFNLNYLTESECFNEFIFSLALFSMSSSGKSMMYLHEKSKIYIEVANTFNDKLFKSVSFLRFLSIYDFQEFSLSDIRFSNDLNYVCRYLRAIDDHSINLSDLKYSTEEKSRKEENIIMLQKYFIPLCEGLPNFHQLTTFTKVLTKLFKNFENSMFSVDIMKYQKHDYEELGINIFENIRSCILESLLETTKEFTSRCVKSVKNSQNSMIGIMEKEEKENEEIVLADYSIKWENSNHFIMIFDSNGDFMNIYRNPEKVPENIKNLIISQTLIEQRIKYNLQDMDVNEFTLENGYIEDYNMYSSEQLMEKLISFYSKYSLVSNDDDFRPSAVTKDIRLSQLYQLGYILTPDNFLKMNLIFIRCISRLPLIIMGETGCGKTSLLRFFVEEILQEKLMIIYIHSGVTSQDISDHLTQANEEAKTTKKDRVWVFFDEFNTSDLIGDLVSVLCDKKHSIILSPKLVFVGACNPYRVKKSINFKENVGIKKKSSNNYDSMQLVHTVKPLPDKAIEFVWDFGVLRPSEIKNYISSMMIKNKVTPVILFTNLITTAHEYFQNSEDVSSVSLRDVNRFTQLYAWFHESIKSRKSLKLEKPLDEYLKIKKILEKNLELQEIFPGLLAFLHCYYLRISCRDDRMQFLYLVVGQAQMFDERFDLELIENLIKLEQLELMSRMNLAEGIALNMALMENIFAIVPCVLNKIPVFICGKPGCSKSLAIQIISSSMRGIKSSDPYFFTLPELQIVSFQGSESCTSEGIQEVFNSAEKLLNRKRTVLPVVLFDEIGLAEVSRHNPLKILHKLLEFENCKVAFIAISNWRLDASKMNRALYLARPDPDKTDLVSTAKTLFHSFGERKDSESCIQVIEKVAKGYSKLKKAMAAENYADFYGLRDFYHTIKLIARRFFQSKEEDLSSLTQEAILRNFNGLEGSSDTLPTYFSEAFSGLNLKVPSSKLISDNLIDSQCRYLMIVCAQDVSEYLKSLLLDHHLPNYKFILGSTFEKDVNEEASRFKILSDIIGYMEQGIPVVMQNMDIIYSSLYDLFNQNFIVLGKTRKYCRVALGAHFNPRCFVHENFKAVVFLDNDRTVLAETDAPLLNRFEKHFVLLKDLIDTELLELSKEIINWVEGIFHIKGKINRLQPGAVFPCFSFESMNLLIQLLKDLPKDQIMKKCQNFLIKNSSFDIVFLSRVNSFDHQEMTKIVKKWREVHLIKFKEYVEKISNRERYLSKEKTAKVICSTFDIIGVDFLKKDLSDLVQFEKCCNFKSENELRQSYQKFIDSKKKTLFLLELDYQKESRHFKFVVSFLDTLSQEIHSEDHSVKNIFILVRIRRCDDQRKPFLLFKGWKYRMFDDLNNQSIEQMEGVIEKDLSEIVKNGELYDFHQHYEEITQKAFDSINFQSPFFSFEYLQTVKKSLIEFFLEDKNLAIVIQRKILESIENSQKMNQDWISNLFISEGIIRSAKSVKDALIISISEKFLLEYTKLIVACEKKSGLSSLKKIKSYESGHLIWTQIFEGLQTLQIQVHLKYDSNNLNYLAELSLPFIYADYKMMKAKYSELVASEVPDEQIASELKDFHLKNSIWKDSAGLLFEDLKTFEFFVSDFVEITLMERAVEKKFTEIIAQILEELMNGLKNEEKMKELFEFQGKIFSFNSIFMIFCKYQKIETLESILEMFKASDEEKDIRLNFMIELIIENICPSFTAEFQSNDIFVYSKDISSLLSFLSSFPKPSNFCMLEFWSELSKLTCMPLVIYTAFMIQGKTHDFLFTNEMAPALLNQFYNYPDLDMSKANKFRMYFMTQLLERNVQMIQVVANEIRAPDTWKISGPLIKTLLKCTDLKAKIKNFERDYADHRKFSEIFENNNQHLNFLVIFIESCEFTDEFCVMLIDKLRLLDFKVKILSALRNCSVYLEVFEDSEKTGNKLKKIVSVARIKFYLHQFMIFSNPDAKVNQENFVEDLGKVLIEKKTLDYELFCLKALKNIANVSTLKLNELCSRTRYPWRINYKEIGVRTMLEVFPYFEAVSVQYKSFLIKVCGLVDNEKELNDIFLKQKNELEVFALGLAFMNSVYFMYTRPNFNKSPYIRWFSMKENLIIQKFGQAFSKLLKFFIENFPEGSFLHLNDETSTKDFHIAMTSTYVMLVGVVFSSVPNQFSRQFFDAHGRVYSNFKENVGKSYFIGAERSKIHDYLSYMKINFNQMKNKNFMTHYARGGSYVCSEDCDYLYIINNCGGAMLESNCPFCNKRIGGTGHQIINRPGHRNLSDDEALKFLEEKANQYNSMNLKGFSNFSTSIPLSCPRRLASDVSFILLNTFTNSMFFFLSLSGLCSEADLRSVYNSGDLPVGSIIQRKIIENLTELNNKHKSEELIYWILSTINDFREVLLNSSTDPSNFTLRDELEKKFEEKILSQTFIDHCNSYKRSISSLREPSILINFIEELNLPQDPSYQNPSLFRFTTVPTWDTLKDAFTLSVSKENYVILSTFINKFEELSNLEHFFNILIFARDMIDECSFTVSRATANVLTVNEFLKTRPQLRRKFENFRKAWSRLRLVLRFDCRDFERVEITGETPIGYLLVDTDINSLGIHLAACLRNLAEFQNNLVSLAHNEKNYKRLSVFNISSEDVFFISNEKLDSVIQSCSNNCLQYGRGQEIVYDWDKVDFYIRSFAEKAKILDSENLPTVQYQFELLHARSRFAGIITDIRQRVPQVNLEDEEVKNFVKLVNVKAFKKEVDVKVVWKQAHTWLEKLFLSLRHSKSLEHQIIGSAQEVHARFEFDLKVSEIFSGFENEKCINLYEITEIEVFEEVLRIVNEQYKIEFFDKTLAKNLISKFCEEVFNRFDVKIPGKGEKVLRESRNVVKRIVLRLLTANTDPKFKIVDYFGIEDYWNQLFLNDAEEAAEVFPQEFCLEHAIYVERELGLKIKELCPDPPIR